MLESKLNNLLSDYVVLSHKTQNFHWYVKGTGFFAAHAALETLYDQTFDTIDEIAEQILMVGGKPVASLAEFAKLASIEEAPAQYIEPIEAYGILKADYEKVLAEVKDVKAAAEEAGVDLIAGAMDELIASLSKSVWMLSQSLL
ncbi:DNA starvation/stationary phase protection protein [Berryella wangjianweii]|uniref:DNA starvation/stationary phase protection protein n=1 Tax=Berryella wangjianweii TaxID=2734634 RepID=A0A6M8J273_9ACTN|nr:DNA starvation/stationary phase protection protein [Berryella wangjianweii]NPD31758.1 DNA starvation/stationary phase protection protein [Eggerthellaceae bacterium zg-997]QKF07644.1 DNA starvation/stationary phase protection protein [Berryella wangjianweii]